VFLSQPFDGGDSVLDCDNLDAMCGKPALDKAAQSRFVIGV
jgi:hypothetical protein